MNLSRAFTAFGLAMLFATHAALAFDERAVEGLIKSGEFATAERFALTEAVSGNPSAQYTMGLLYEASRFERCNLATAMDWYQRAADRNYGKAQFQLAVLYYRDINVVRNPALAFQLMLRAAQNNVVSAYSLLARLYFDGDGVDRDTSQAIQWAQIGAERGNWPAIGMLSYYYYEGLTGRREIGKALDLMNRFGPAPFSGPGHFVNGLLYRDGIGGPVDIARAVSNLESAVISDFPPAMRELAAMYDVGLGVPRDLDKADALRIRATSAEEHYRIVLASRGEGGIKDPCVIQ